MNKDEKHKQEEVINKKPKTKGPKFVPTRVPKNKAWTKAKGKPKKTELNGKEPKKRKAKR